MGRWLLFSAGALLSLASFGCANPEGALSDFEARDKAIHPGSSSSGGDAGACMMVPMPGAVKGDYFFSLAAKINPMKPIAMLATVDTPATGGGTGFQATLQPLSAMDQKTPVGMPIPSTPVKVGTDGSFTLTAGTINVDGAANAISPGLPISADAVELIGTLCDPGTFVCGTLNGMLTKPFSYDLDGSTWTMQKITDPMKYPTPILDCAMNKP